jgi:tetratricopeptide (TPR) repeat protein
VEACNNIVQLNPNAAFMVGAASIWLGMVGRFDQAFPLLEQSLELNPCHPGWFQLLPWLHAFAHQDYDEALSAARKFRMPTFFWGSLTRAAAFGKLGRVQEATSAYQKVLRLHPSFAVRPDYYVGCFVHNDKTRTDVLDGLTVAGMR